MGAELRIFNLYQLTGPGEVKYLLARAQRPEFRNSSQVEEDAAMATVEKIFSNILTREKGIFGFELAQFVATWEGGFPEGEVFYGKTSGLAVDVWISLDTKYTRYFAFGSEPTEEAFWDSLRDLYEAGDLWGPSLALGAGEFKR